MWMAVATIAILAFLAGCGSDSPSDNGGGDDDPVNVTVDESIDLPNETLPTAPGDDPRPVAAIVGDHGHQAEFVENELWIQPLNETELDEFLARWNGEVIGEFDPGDYGLGGNPVQYLVRVETDAADTSNLPQLMSELSGVSTGDFRVSSDAALKLLAASADEAGAGLDVGINWIGRGSSFMDNETTEAANGDPSDYDADAFTWKSHASGNTQDIGVAEAWRILEVAGKLDNRVRIAILDMGFSAIRDYATPVSVISNVPWVVSPMETSNILNCGSPCPWHGNMVASTAMGLADDEFGAAGPAGPIGDPILVFTLYDFFTSISAVGAAYAAGADIANMSYGAAIPGILAWTAGPFELATLGFREAGMLIFASAGNDGDNVDDETCFGPCWENTLHTPCENGGVICVGGIAYDSQNRASNSNYGSSGGVDIYAPYTLLVGPDPGNPANYARLVNGTSFSSPFTAGVAALIWAANPSLSADEVETILYDTAHTSPDGRVNRYVNAAAAVRMAIGDAAPYIEITGPSNGSSFPRGSTSVSFSATASDVEDGTPTVTWTSNRDGEIGTGTFFSRTDLSVGTHLITARATDTAANESTDQVSITITNTPPTMSIDSPSDGATFYMSQTISFQGSSYDPNELGPLPNGSVEWIIDDVSRGGNHSLSLAASVLGVGSHTVTFRGFDGSASGEDQIKVNVQSDPVNVPPSVAIWSPSNGASLWVDTYDSTEGAWYVEVAFSGTATDPEDGNLNGTDVRWIARRSGAADEVLGTGTGMTARLYSRQSFGTEYTIILEATDSDGETSSTSIQVTVNNLS